MTRDAAQERVIRSLKAGTQLRLHLIESCLDSIIQAAEVIHRCFLSGGKLLLFGNGGSAADAQHLAAEFVGRFLLERIPLPAIALTTDSSILTAVGNDYGFEQLFARQVQALGVPGDMVIAISTSGHSPNVLAGVDAAHAQGLTTVGITGNDGGQLASIVDVAIVVPSANTARIQECHIAIGHLLCELVETWLFAEDGLEDDAATTDSFHPLTCKSKVMDWDMLLALREQWRVQGNKVVWTNGCFDLLHVGHLRGLCAARSLGDKLIVGVNSDDSVRQLKGAGRPIVPASERAELLAALECVDCVIVFDGLTPELVLSRLQPDIHSKGDDYLPPHGKPIPEARLVEAYGGQVRFFPLVPSISTSDLVRRILSQNGNNSATETNSQAGTHSGCKETAG